jgi:hypothetical protein
VDEYDYDPDFDDYEVVQDLWSEDGDDLETSFEEASDENDEIFYDYLDHDAILASYGYSPDGHRVVDQDFFDKGGLLEYWQSTWGRLTEIQQKSFLMRHEVEMICEWPIADVETNIKKEKKLLIVLALLRQGRT